MRQGLQRAALVLAVLLTASQVEARCWKGETVSWYVDLHTASGEYYTQRENTCAHRTAPFNSRLRVTDGRTGKSVVCRVNDRGPNPWTKCTVDLNKHAAKKLGILKRGVAKAKIEVVGPEKPATTLALVEKARAFIGTNPTGWHSLWCAKFMAMLVPELARRVSNPNFARDWAELPRTTPRVGVIVVLARGRRGGHIGVVSGFDRHGNPRVVSGNHGHRVAESVYPKSRVIAYVASL